MFRALIGHCSHPVQAMKRASNQPAVNSQCFSISGERWCGVPIPERVGVSGLTFNILFVDT